jgi:hypothetical protein
MTEHKIRVSDKVWNMVQADNGNFETFSNTVERMLEELLSLRRGKK